MTSIPKAFIYEGNEYIKVTPGKNLFHSTMIHEVVNRGDIFAVRLHDQTLTIIPGIAKVTPIKMAIEHNGDCRTIRESRQTELLL